MWCQIPPRFEPPSTSLRVRDIQDHLVEIPEGTAVFVWERVGLHAIAVRRPLMKSVLSMANAIEFCVPRPRKSMAAM